MGPTVEIDFKQSVSWNVKLKMLESSHVIPGCEKRQTTFYLLEMYLQVAWYLMLENEFLRNVRRLGADTEYT